MGEEPVCEKCNGIGWELVDGNTSRRCECYSEKRIRRYLERARIPKRYQHAGFDNFQTASPSLYRALQTSKKYASEHPLVDVGLLYLGSCGVGKTHLAAAVLQEIIRKGNAGLFYDFRDLLKEIQSSYNPVSQASELKILAPVLDTECLVLDELGANKPTEWVQDTITYIINERYNEKRVTIFTSNYLDKPAGPMDESLSERVGVRLRSRLEEMCRVILIEADDFRKEIGKKRKGRFVD
ncbi:MAG: ATP-binding protein [Acidobacteriota bacterium]